jgi:hypothetical protein
VGEHQLSPKPLAQWMPRDHAFEVRHERGVSAELKLGFEALLERGEPGFFEPSDLRLREGGTGEIGQDRTAPQGERLVEHCYRSLGLLLCKRLPRAADKFLEPLAVELSPVHPQHVAGDAGDKDLAGRVRVTWEKRLPQL